MSSELVTTIASLSIGLNVETLESVEGQLSAQVLAYLRLSTEDVAAPPPRDALAGLSAVCSKGSAEELALVRAFRNASQNQSTNSDADPLCRSLSGFADASQNPQYYVCTRL